ncbi:MAG: VWA domain-containing protein, partial [Dokdonella sp.]
VHAHRVRTDADRVDTQLVRDGDRVGLILFGSQAYLQVPLTFDLRTVSQQLREASIGLAGRETAIGDAVGLAVKRLRERPAEQRVLILLTDGVNTAGVLQPDKAAELAKTSGLRVYTVGVGADSMRVDSLFGSRVVNPSQDLDETMLTQMAEATGGEYFRARDSAELARIYQQIDTLEPAAGTGTPLRPINELYWMPLSLALLLAMLGMLAPVLVRRHDEAFAT